jgi:FkbM family methyltransferase
LHPLRLLGRRFGLDIHRFNPFHSFELRLARFLAAHSVSLVFDVGANSGQYAKMLRQTGYGGRIISFEPLFEPHAQLLEASKHDPNWSVPAPVALGARRGTVEMQIAGNSASSSVLPMLDSHLRAAPNSMYVGTETVALTTLDEVAQLYIGSDDRAFLKIDVQGFEGAVLDGAEETLARVIGIQLEMSLVPLYRDQPLLQDMYERVIALGFVPWAIVPGYSNPHSWQMLQCDGIFFKPTQETL